MLGESPAAYLERIMEAFRQYTPMDPTADEIKAAVMMAFVNQAAPDIKRKLQKIDRLGEKSLQDLLEIAEKVYNNRETPEERQERIRQDRKYQAKEFKRVNKEMTKILLAAATENTKGWKDRNRGWDCPCQDGGKQGPQRKGKLEKDQCKKKKKRKGSVCLLQRERTLS